MTAHGVCLLLAIRLPAFLQQPQQFFASGRRHAALMRVVPGLGRSKVALGRRGVALPGVAQREKQQVVAARSLAVDFQ